MPQCRKQSHSELAALLCALACAVALGACAPAAVSEATATPPAQPAGPHLPVEITFVDSAGFLIASGGEKVLVDAHSGLAPQKVRTLLAQAQAPFDDIDLILVTHNHSDHFNASLIGAHMEKSPNTVFASTDRAVADLRAKFPALDQARLRPFEPKEGERLRVALNGIDLEILNLPHGAPVTNLGFVIDVGGRKLLHTGDTASTPDLEAYGLAEENIDIAFVPYFPLVEEEFLTEGGQSPMLRAIHAKRIVPMHLRTMEPNRESILEELAASYPDSILFHETMETQTVP
jgi:L-ascorbate metabolism protein UlaG (beta-lactamase superfamily)